MMIPKHRRQVSWKSLEKFTISWNKQFYAFSKNWKKEEKKFPDIKIVKDWNILRYSIPRGRNSVEFS